MSTAYLSVNSDILRMRGARIEGSVWARRGHHSNSSDIRRRMRCCSCTMRSKCTYNTHKRHRLPYKTVGSVATHARTTLLKLIRAEGKSSGITARRSSTQLNLAASPGPAGAPATTVNCSTCSLCGRTEVRCGIGGDGPESRSRRKPRDTQ